MAIPFKVGDKIEVTIDRLAAGGAGVSRHDGVVVFVPLTAPGDRVIVRVTFIKKNFAEAEMVKVLTAGHSRREPLCPAFGECGGCNWQHISYEEQLVQKRNIIEFGVKRLEPSALVQPIIPSPEEWRYRHRIQIHIDEGKLGFLRRRSHKIVDIQDCPITEGAVVNQFGKLRTKYAVAEPTRLEVGLRENGDFYEIDLQKEDHAFSQANRYLNKQLLQTALDFLARFSTTSLLDLYCGEGNFTFAAAERFPKMQISGVEFSANAVELAKKQSLAYGERVQFFQGDVAHFLTDTKPSSDRAFLLDPPRTGCDSGVLQALLTHAPELIVYVSCNPATFFRDVGELKKGGYALKEIQPLDMFPQTDHVELVALLTNAAGRH